MKKESCVCVCGKLLLKRPLWSENEERRKGGKLFGLCGLQQVVCLASKLRGLRRVLFGRRLLHPITQNA